MAQGHGGNGLASGETMSARLPQKLISIPMEVDPRSRYHRGGSMNCEHHYVEGNATAKYKEWICLNCDRICGFYKWDKPGVFADLERGQ